MRPGARERLGTILLMGASALIFMGLGTLAYVENSYAVTSVRPLAQPTNPIRVLNLDFHESQECSGHNGLLHHVRNLGSEKADCPVPQGENPPGRPPSSVEEEACRVGGLIGCLDERTGRTVVIGSAFVVSIPGVRSRSVHIATASHNLVSGGRSRRGCVFEPYGRSFLRVPILAAYVEPEARDGAEFGVGDRAIARLGTNEAINSRGLNFLQFTGSIRLEPSLGESSPSGGMALKASATDQGRPVVLGGFHPESRTFMVSRNCQAFRFDPNRDNQNRSDIMVHSCSTSPLGMGSGGPVLSSSQGRGRIECIHGGTLRGRYVTEEGAGTFRREVSDSTSNFNYCRPITPEFVQAAIDFMGGTQQATRR